MVTIIKGINCLLSCSHMITSNHVLSSFVFKEKEKPSIQTTKELIHLCYWFNIQNSNTDLHMAIL